MVRQIHHHTHVVLHHQHSHAPFAPHLKNETRHVFGFLAVHACNRLVKQQQFGFHGQRTRQFNALLQTVRQGRHGRMANVVYLKEINDAFFDFAPEFVFFAPCCRGVKQSLQRASLQMTVTAQLDVVEHCHAAKQRNVLKTTRQTQRCALWCSQAIERLPGKTDAASAGAIKARNGVENRCFSSTVRTNHRSNGVRLNLETHALQGLDPAKRQRQIKDFQKGRSCVYSHMFPDFFAFFTRVKAKTYFQVMSGILSSFMLNHKRVWSGVYP